MGWEGKQRPARTPVRAIFRDKPIVGRAGAAPGTGGRSSRTRPRKGWPKEAEDVASAQHERLGLVVKYPQFGKYWLGSVVSVFGDQIGWVALVWLVLRIGGGPAAVGIVTFLYQVPQAIVAPLAGVWLDRLPRTKVMALANAFIGLLFLAIPFVASVMGGRGLFTIYGLAAAAGCALPFDTTGGAPLVGELVPEEKWSSAYFLTQTPSQIASLIGPALGGVLIAVIGTEPLLYVDAITFFVLAAVLHSIPGNIPPRRATEKRSFTGEFAEGIHFLRSARSILALSVVTFFFYMLYGPYNVVLPVLAKRRYGGSAEFGLLWAVFSAGALIGSLVFSRSSWRHRLSVTLAAIIVLWGAVTFAMAFAQSFVWALIIMGIGGFEYAPWSALVVTARQRMVPKEMQARVTGVTQAITIGGEPVGALTAGLVLHWAGAFSTLLYAGVATVLVGTGALAWPAFRALDQGGQAKLGDHSPSSP